MGAMLMYFLDPQSGRRRRARTRDQWTHARRVLGNAREVTARDTVHRAIGMVASARKLFDHAPVSDETLIGRVRAALGRVVSHPHAIEVSASDGHVTLSGPILAQEARGLVSCVRHVPGVRGVSDQLELHNDASHISSLQGGSPRPGDKFELLQENWSPAARLVTGGLGAAMLLGATRARGGMCAILGIAGTGLLARAITNYDFASLVGAGKRGITVQKMVNVNAPVDEVFSFWTDYRNFPRFMHNVRDVRQIADNRSRWVVAGPAGVPVEWTAEVTRVIPGQLIEWCSSPDSDVHHEGSVHFEANTHGGTRVNVQLCYMPPAGAFGHAVARIFGADPKSEMDADLLRMKTMIETGRPPHDAAKPLPRES
jgi:uncharacterized membrane protein